MAAPHNSGFLSLITVALPNKSLQYTNRVYVNEEDLAAMQNAVSGSASSSVIDDLVRQSLAHQLCDQTQVLYVSPLKALSNDVHKNLQVPLAGIRAELLESGLPDAPIRAAVRTGDTPQSERARMR